MGGVATVAEMDAIRQPYNKERLTKVDLLPLPSVKPTSSRNQCGTLNGTQFLRGALKPLGDNRTRKAPSTLKGPAVCSHSSGHILQVQICFP